MTFNIIKASIEKAILWGASIKCLEYSNGVANYITLRTYISKFDQNRKIKTKDRQLTAIVIVTDVKRNLVLHLRQMKFKFILFVIFVKEITKKLPNVR